MPDTSEILWKIPPTLPTQRFPKYLRYSLRLLEVFQKDLDKLFHIIGNLTYIIKQFRSKTLLRTSEILWERYDAYLRLLNTFVLLVLRGAPYLSQKFSEFDKGLVDNSNVTPSLRGLFPLSDLWYSSQSPSHRQSTFTTHEITFGS